MYGFIILNKVIKLRFKPESASGDKSLYHQRLTTE